MRKIETQAEKDARERKRNRVIGIILLGIMLLSTAGYALLSYTSTPPENTGSDPNAYGRNLLKVGGQTLYLVYSRSDVQNVSLQFNTTLRDYAGSVLYASSDSDAALYELSSTLGKYTSKFQEACYGSCEKNLPEKNCSQPLIIFSLSENMSVSQEEQCIFIRGDVRSVDAFLYRIFETP